MQKHKHSELIHAWADGAEIQFKFNGKWLDKANDGWDASREYRIKPEKKVIRYRRFLHDDNLGIRVECLPDIQTFSTVDEVEAWPGFIRWIDTEWQEVEV